MKAPTTKSIDIIDSGTYVARLYSIIEIGTIPYEYMGEIKRQDKIRLTFELPNETKVFNEEKGEQPYVISQEFTFSMHPKSKLKAFIDGWLGKTQSDIEAIDTDLDDFLGKEGLLNVVHAEGKNGNTYANIGSITPLPKGMTCPEAVNLPIVLYYTQWDQKVFDSLPEFIREKMSKSEEYQTKFESHDEEEVTIEDLEKSGL